MILLPVGNIGGGIELLNQFTESVQFPLPRKAYTIPLQTEIHRPLLGSHGIALKVELTASINVGLLMKSRFENANN